MPKYVLFKLYNKWYNIPMVVPNIIIRRFSK